MIDRSSTGIIATLCWALNIALALVFAVARARAGETVIHQFNLSQGYYPNSGLVSDAAGNFYGTTSAGGKNNCGTAFELSPGSNGTWTETLLFSFHGCQFPGPSPIGTMVFDQAGNLYGAAQGDFNTDGVIYKLSKGAGNTWSETIIHSFGLSEGAPLGDLAFDNAGNLYGATSAPYTTFDGEIFELSPQPDGTWTETVLITFPAANGVGGPAGGPIFDSKGNLYGATFYGIGGYEGNSRGAVYELSPQANGPWTLTVLYNFTKASTTQFPESRLTFDSSGNLYGTAEGGSFYGSIFEVSPGSAGGAWTETTIHSFNSGSDGGNPRGTLVVDTAGNVYGATSAGGIGCNGNLCGTVCKFTPQSAGTWKETILHPFESATDGSIPEAGVFMDSSGNLYGTTYHGGGRYGYGTVYEITP